MEYSIYALCNLCIYGDSIDYRKLIDVYKTEKYNFILWNILQMELILFNLSRSWSISKFINTFKWTYKYEWIVCLLSDALDK